MRQKKRMSPLGTCARKNACHLWEHVPEKTHVTFGNMRQKKTHVTFGNMRQKKTPQVK
jgi:hypothetical protein